MSYEQYISRVSSPTDDEIKAIVKSDNSGIDYTAAGKLDILVEFSAGRKVANKKMSSEYADIAPFIKVVEVGDEIALVWKAERIAYWRNSDMMAEAVGKVELKEQRDIDDQAWHYVSERLLCEAIKCLRQADDDNGLAEIEALEGDDFLITYDSWY